MSEFDMPEVEIGDQVYWYPDGNRCEKPATAFVTDVGERVVMLSVIVRDMVCLIPKVSVRHVTDPGLLIQANRQNGGWDYMPSQQMRARRRAEAARRAEAEAEARREMEERQRVERQRAMEEARVMAEERRRQEAQENRESAMDARLRRPEPALVPAEDE